MKLLLDPNSNLFNLTKPVLLSLMLISFDNLKGEYQYIKFKIVLNNNIPTNYLRD